MGASLLAPFMPETAEKIAKQLNTELRDFDTLQEFGGYPSGNTVTDAPEILFARQDLKEVMEKVEALQARQRAEAGVPQEQAAPETTDEKVVDIEKKPEITYEDLRNCSSRWERSSTVRKFPNPRNFFAPR